MGPPKKTNTKSKTADLKDHDEDDVDTAPAAAAALASPVDEFSPPLNKRTRSSKKESRKRPAEEITEERDQDPKQKRQRVVALEENEGKNDSQDESDKGDGDIDTGRDEDDNSSSQQQETDEEMEEEEDDCKIPAVEETGPPARTNGSRLPQQQQRSNAAIVVGATSSSRIPPVENLRMVSQQTPGRVQERERLRNEAAAEIAASVPPLPSKRLVFEHQVPAAAKNQKVPPRSPLQRQQQQQHQRTGLRENGDRTIRGEVEEEGDEDVEVPAHGIRKLLLMLDSVYAWLFILLVLQVLCYPMVTRKINAVSEKYTFWLGSSTHDHKMSAAEARIRDALGEFDQLLPRIGDYEERFSNEFQALEQNQQHFLASVEKEKHILSMTAQKLDALAQTLESALESSELFSGTLEEARELLGDEDPLLDLSFMQDWKFPESPECDNADKAKLSARAVELKQEAIGRAQKAMENPETEGIVREWLRNSILDEIPQYESTVAAVLESEARFLQTTGTATRVSLHELQRTISARFELERADQTGQIDYASILNGASVIRTGERATTPSLIDTLPILNRIASLLSMRFYGYGPEAALTPSTTQYAPTTATLGQCWSFRKHVDSSHLSAYATLSVRLGKPVRVQRISIEHPPPEVSDRKGSAIRTFRVLGFEGPQAEGRAWALGSFEYKIDDAIRQEFQSADHVKGERVPVLESISVAIDSNWGMEYSCLYRLRVFGKEES